MIETIIILSFSFTVYSVISSFYPFLSSLLLVKARGKYIVFQYIEVVQRSYLSAVALG